LQWIEVDFPAMIDYKEEVLAGEKPRCALERVRMDLADLAGRRALFQRLGSNAKKALVLTERSPGLPDTRRSVSTCARSGCTEHFQRLGD